MKARSDTIVRLDMSLQTARQLRFMILGEAATHPPDVRVPWFAEGFGRDRGPVLSSLAIGRSVVRGMRLPVPRPRGRVLSNPSQTN